MTYSFSTTDYSTTFSSPSFILDQPRKFLIQQFMWSYFDDLPYTVPRAITVPAGPLSFRLSYPAEGWYFPEGSLITGTTTDDDSERQNIRIAETPFKQTGYINGYLRGTWSEPHINDQTGVIAFKTTQLLLNKSTGQTMVNIHCWDTSTSKWYDHFATMRLQMDGVWLSNLIPGSKYTFPSGSYIDSSSMSGSFPLYTINFRQGKLLFTFP